MLGLGRHGLRRILSRRGMAAAVAQAATSQQQSQNPQFSAGISRKQQNGTRNQFGSSTPVEQVKLQEKYKENLQNNKMESLHDAVEMIEWRGSVFIQTMQKIVKLLENSPELATLSDRQLSVILSVFGAKCDTVSRVLRQELLENVEKILKNKNIKLGLQSINQIIECKIDNKSGVDVLEELQKLEEAGIEADSKTYALLCEVCAKQAITIAIIEILNHMKSSNIQLTEDHVAQLVYSEAKSGNGSQVDRIVQTFSNQMNVVRLRCAAGRAIVEREKNENGKGGYEVTEMLRMIPTTAKIHSLENNIYVVNILMDLIENGQFDAFNLLSSYLMVSQDGKYLADTHLNVPVVARSKSLLSEGKIAEAINLYTVVNPAFANDFFLKDLTQKLENQLKNLKNDDFEGFLKLLVLAENRGLIRSVQDFLLSSCVKQQLESFSQIFEFVKSSGNLRNVLMANASLKKPLARQLGHQLINEKNEEKKAKLLADIAMVLYAPSKEETIQEMRGFNQIVYKLANKDVKLVIPTIEKITEMHEQREFGAAIIDQLLRAVNDDHLAIDKLKKLIESNKIQQIANNRVHYNLTKLIVSSSEKDHLKLAAKILALEFPTSEGGRSVSSRYLAKNLAKFFANEMIDTEKMEKIIGFLENENRVGLTSPEVQDGQEILKENQRKKELFGRLKKSQTMTRWLESTVEDLIKELNNFGKDTKPVIVNTLRKIIIQKTLETKKNDLPFIVQLLEQAVEWRKGMEEKPETERIRESIKNLESETLSKAVYANDMVLADRIWLMRSGHLSADVLLAYASRLFLNNEKERADEVCEDLRKSAQPIRPVTLEKTGRKLKGVEITRMGELSEYLAEKFNLKKTVTRRIVARVKLDQLEGLIKQKKLAEALQMAVDETKESGRAFGQVPIMIEAIKRNDRKVLETVYAMVKNAHNSDMANVNLAYALLYSDHVEQAKQLVEKQNLHIEDKVLQYFAILGVSSNNHQVLKNLFIVFNGRASTLQLNNLLETVTRLLWKSGDLEGLQQLDKEIEMTSFPLQNKLRSFFENLDKKHVEPDYEF